MNYHLQNESNLIDVIKYDGDPLLKTGFSRDEQYFLYKGLNRFLTKPYGYKNYAKLYIRVDNKKLEIKRKYQQLIEFYGEHSSSLIGVFVILNIVFSFINNCVFNHIIVQKLFFFEGLINNNSMNSKISIKTSKSTQLDYKDDDYVNNYNNNMPSQNGVYSKNTFENGSPYNPRPSSQSIDKLTNLKKKKLNIL